MIKSKLYSSAITAIEVSIELFDQLKNGEIPNIIKDHNIKYNTDCRFPCITINGETIFDKYYIIEKIGTKNISIMPKKEFERIYTELDITDDTFLANFIEINTNDN